MRHSDVHQHTDDVYFLLEPHPKERSTCTCGDVTTVSIEGSGSKSSGSTPQGMMLVGGDITYSIRGLSLYFL